MFELTLQPDDAKLLRDVIQWRIQQVQKSTPYNTRHKAETILRLKDLLKEFDLNLNKLPQ
jgi:hypothetical protein